MNFNFIPPDLMPFQSLDGETIFLLVVSYLATAVIRGAFGFGAIAPAIVFSSLIIEPHYAILLALVT